MVAKPIKVLLVDDQDIIIIGIKTVLSKVPNVQVVGEALSGEEAIECARCVRPDVAVLAMRMPGMSGTQTAEVLLQQPCAPAVIGMSHLVHGGVIRNFLATGALGFIMKDFVGSQIAMAVQVVACGSQFICPTTQSHLERANRMWAKSGLGDLTTTEKGILTAFAEGYELKEIASDRGISVSTVNVHMRNIRKKVGDLSPASLIRCAMDNGLVSP